MKCKINVVIGGETIPIVVGIDSSLIPSEINEDFMNLVKNSKNLEAIKDAVKSKLLEGINEKISREEFGKYLIANSTAKEIMLSAPASILSLFPDIDLSSIKVRLVDKFEEDNIGVIIKLSVNGELIYLLERSLKSFKKFAEHLALENTIDNDVLGKLDENSEEIKIIDLLINPAKLKFNTKKSPSRITDRKSLLKHYIKNKNKYAKINILYNNGTYTASYLLDRIIPKIKGVYTPRNNKYSTLIVANLFSPGGIVYNNGLPQISYNSLYNILIGLIDLSMFKSAKEFNEEMSSKEKSENVIKFFNLFNVEDIESDENENYSILFELIFKEERGFPFFYSTITKDGLIKFLSNYYSFGKAHDMSYDTIIRMEKSNYRGWIIAENELGEFFISQYEMLPDSKGLSYSSEEEAKIAIDLRIAKLTFRSSFMLPLMLNLGKINGNYSINIPVDFDTLLKGNVLKILNIELPLNVLILDPRENIVVSNNTISDFKDTIKLWSKKVLDLLIDSDGNLIKDINNVSKAGIFLILLNNKYLNQTRTPEMIKDILSIMKEAKYKYFYVEGVKRIPKLDEFGKPVKRNGQIVYVLKNIKLTELPENPNNILDDYRSKNGFLYPLISLWEESSEILNKLFGTNINIRTLSEIEDEFGSRYSSLKAFIIGDLVYINSTLGSTEDLFHEYIHIIMGYLKVNNPEAYSTLLLKVWDATSNYERSKINDRKNGYGDYDYTDKLEENFVKRFADYIYNHGLGKFNLVFNSSVVEDAFETIFDKAEFNIKEAGKHLVSEIFGRFCSEISMALQKDNKLFNGFASSEEFKLSNKKTNLLYKWIKEGKLKELDCR